LTARQQEVLRLLADRIPAKVIATQLGVTEATVRNHVRAILPALAAHSQVEAIAKARRKHLRDRDMTPKLAHRMHAKAAVDPAKHLQTKPFSGGARDDLRLSWPVVSLAGIIG
jgi:DNA-binding CsgD family transcriptional regulator